MILPGCAFKRCDNEVAVHFGGGVALCDFHVTDVWLRIERRDARNRHLDIPGREGRDYERVDARALASAGRRKPTAVGQIYYVQTGDLIKVGWTSKLADRVRAYGPTARLLVHYTGTKADEAALHRQLTPCRYRGREWYHDGPIIRSFIEQALAEHGPPRFDDLGWTEPKQVVASKRHR